MALIASQATDPEEQRQLLMAPRPSQKPGGIVDRKPFVGGQIQAVTGQQPGWPRGERRSDDRHSWVRWPEVEVEDQQPMKPGQALVPAPPVFPR